LQSGKGIPESSQWKIEATFLIRFGGWGGERRKEMFAILQYFWRRIRRTRFPSKFCLFYEIRKLKEEKEGEKKQLLIRPLKICLLFVKKYFTSESANFFWIFFAIFKPENLIFNIKKHCMYVEMAQIRKNFYL
jgi:hypothetical protein